MWDEARLMVAAEELVDRDNAENRGAARLDLAAAQAHLHQFQEFEIPGAQLNIARPAEDVPRTRRQVLVMEAAARIRLRQNCPHAEWHPVSVGGDSQRGTGQTCDLCQHTLRKYLLECRLCLTRVCVRCKRKRLRRDVVVNR